MKSWTKLILIAALLTGLCSAHTATSSETESAGPIRFKGRAIEVPDLGYIPMNSLFVFHRERKILYRPMAAQTSKFLESQWGINAAVRVARFDSGREISDQDFLKRSVWNAAYRRGDDSYYLISDERNDEHFN